VGVYGVFTRALRETDRRRMAYGRLLCPREAGACAGPPAR
jgi:hypothetical protein